MIKRIRNHLVYYFKIVFIKIFRLTPWAKDVKIFELIRSNFSDFQYISNKLKFVHNSQKLVGKYFIDSSFVKTDLCSIGEKFKTDKSPYNKISHRHPYTGIYEFLFSNIRYEEINFAEIGILQNSSIKMWRNYFKYANVYAFEFDKDLIRLAKKDNLKNVSYREIDVTKKQIIAKSFESCKCLFDVIIDDSTHTFIDQINIIQVVYKYLSPGGILVIEDIPKNNLNYSDERFTEKIKNLNKYFSFMNFVECEHINKFSKGWDNDKMLILVRNDIK